MRFALTDEQRVFAASLDDLLSGADTPNVARQWARGDPAAGLKLWKRLADLGVTGLLVSEEAGGLGADPTDVVVAFEQLGRHVVPGPWVESVAFVPTLIADLADLESSAGLLRGLASGVEVTTLAAPPRTPLALDADVATRLLLLDEDGLHTAFAGTLRRSVDPARRLFSVEVGRPLVDPTAPVVEAAFDTAALACAAQLLGSGERLLSEAVTYAKQRRQFGRPIGEFQALKHAMADVRVGLDFARPLVYGASLTISGPGGQRDVSAAKVAAGEAAYHAARTALQVHGAVGYTAEHHLGLWVMKVRALVGAWGTPSYHRGRVLSALVERGDSAVPAVWG